MSKKITAVIDSHYGDSGKGLITAYLAKQDPGAVVVRYCGGANAGHTVQMDGKRHVFHHFGSGTFTGNRTYLANAFIVNPLLYCKEVTELEALGHKQIKLEISGACRVTTPFDMLINQEIETRRGSLRHGSCGVGIFETFKRCNDPEYGMYARGVFEPGGDNRLRGALHRIADYWVPYRLHLLRIDPSETFKAMMADKEHWIEKFIHACREMRELCTVNELQHIESDHLIFEGSQGLLLHQSHEYFPHVTPAQTGIEIPSEFAKALDVGCIDAFYVTRTYVTRHGAGPFPEEDRSISHVDPTNSPNPWQGTMRFGRLNRQSMAMEISRDVHKSAVRVNSASLAVTWMDALPDDRSRDAFLLNLMKEAKMPIGLVSEGPDVSDVYHPEAISVS